MASTRKKPARKKAAPAAPKKKVSAAKRLEKFSGSELKKAYMKELSDKVADLTLKQYQAKKKSDKNKIGKDIAATKAELRKLC